VLEVLNDERRFLPFLSETPEHERFVLNKEHILRVRMRSAASGDEAHERGGWEFETPDQSTVQLLDGRKLRGQLHIDTRPNASRPLDKLNQADTFVAIHCADGIEFVQTAAVVRMD
jgi:hypothetical protein